FSGQMDTRFRDRLANLLIGQPLPVRAPAPGPLTTASPIFATPPSGPPAKTPQQIAAERREQERAAQSATRNAEQVEAAMARLQRMIDDLSQQVFPRVVTATEEWNKALADEIALLEKGTAAQRQRAEVLRATGEAMARTIDLIKRSGLDEFTPN